MSNTIQVLDKGYVRLVDVLGSDLSPVNAARASFAKESKEMTDGDAKLIKYLVKNDHTSPFRHAFFTFEVRAPLMVARQWFKYVVGSGHTDPMMAWNENSFRYISLPQEFYQPNENEWRSAPANRKQGSGECLPAEIGADFTQMLDVHIGHSIQMYEAALEAGIAPEQARLFLPAYGMYVNWYWSGSLASGIHFLNQRLEEDAQKEIQEYAKAVRDLLQPRFPVTFEALMGD